MQALLYKPLHCCYFLLHFNSSRNKIFQQNLPQASPEVLQLGCSHRVYVGFLQVHQFPHTINVTVRSF